MNAKQPPHIEVAYEGDIVAGSVQADTPANAVRARATRIVIERMVFQSR